MSRVTDVLVAVDTETILQKYPNASNPNNPLLIDWHHIDLITNQDNVISGQAGGELNLKAEAGDLVRWRESSVSLGFEKQVIFYKFIANQGGELITTPRLAETSLPVPNTSDPAKPKCQTVQNYFWSSEVLKRGRVTYHFQFVILDRRCQICGCCQWDPFITIEY
ncbi:inclusion body protein [Burkholderia sp. ABCPW 14]|uniref:inclusion body family protein n=1 Tax=Burkholderia sp. ABCPW 14 TaxID=1637860 RepID=UPI000770C4F4|nr:inclusion body family protein [Burkholderia sp. ABCPW 14]KVD78920.1 inclusion body protein [Burkholderia sp. ABCPW 14]